jgi:hypothetical protein
MAQAAVADMGRMGQMVPLASVEMAGLGLVQHYRLEVHKITRAVAAGRDKLGRAVRLPMVAVRGPAVRMMAPPGRKILVVVVVVLVRELAAQKTVAPVARAL